MAWNSPLLYRAWTQLRALIETRAGAEDDLQHCTFWLLEQIPLVTGATINMFFDLPRGISDLPLTALTQPIPAIMFISPPMIGRETCWSVSQHLGLPLFAEQLGWLSVRSSMTGIADAVRAKVKAATILENCIVIVVLERFGALEVWIGWLLDAFDWGTDEEPTSRGI